MRNVCQYGKSNSQESVVRIRIKVRKKKSEKRETLNFRQGSPRYWAAVGSMAACTVLGGGVAAPAYGLQVGSQQPPSTVGAASIQPARRFRIGAGPLNEVLARLRELTGLRVELIDARAGTVDSPGITGLYSPEEALRKALAGTGLTVHQGGAGQWIIEMPTLKASVDVTERMPMASPKYTAPVRDLPQTIMVIPKAVMEQQGATSLTEVLRNVPGLTIAAGEGGVPAGDNLTLRGFSARNDLFVDGVRDIGPNSRDPFNLEQVEVVKGPQSAFTGRGSTGGSINMVTKSPGLNKAVGASVAFGTAGLRRFSTDVNTPLRFLGERTGFRANLLWHEGGVAGRDVVHSERWGMAPSLLFGSGTPTRFTLSYQKLRQDNIPDYGIPWVTATQNVLAAYRDQPAPVPRNTFYGLKQRDHEDLNSDMATARYEHEFSDTLSLRNQFRFGRTKRDSVVTAPRFASNDNLIINRSSPSWVTQDDIWDNQTDVRAQFDTGGVTHSVVGGAAFTRENNQRVARTAANIPTTTFLNPDANQPWTGTFTFSAIQGDATGNTQAGYLFDTAKLHRKFEVNGGLRWERFDTSGINSAGAALNRNDTMTSLRAAAIFRPVEPGTVYVSYGTSMNPSLEGVAYQTANTAIEPEKSYTTEVGTKWDLLGSRLLLSGALFRVEKTNARTPGVLPDEPAQVLQGNQVVNGAELGVTGNITRSLRLFGAYTLLESEITKSNTPAEVGKRFINTPRHSMSLWSSYSARRLTVGGGVRFIDSRFGNNTNTRRVDAYWTLDALAQYALNKHLDLRVNLYNLNNAYYFERLGGGHLVPGAARSAMVTTNFRF